MTGERSGSRSLMTWSSCRKSLRSTVTLMLDSAWYKESMERSTGFRSCCAEALCNDCNCASMILMFSTIGPRSWACTWLIAARTGRMSTCGAALIESAAAERPRSKEPMAAKTSVFGTWFLRMTSKSGAMSAVLKWRTSARIGARSVRCMLNTASRNEANSGSGCGSKARTSSRILLMPVSKWPTSNRKGDKSGSGTLISRTASTTNF
mmetsp:Transcript_200/g.661  ORF Transcript_200/g.661 Transcript_200/m.661 type:complete len:208 (-) Transcript_200:1153-1776(-)